MRSGKPSVVHSKASDWESWALFVCLFVVQALVLGVVLGTAIQLWELF